MDEELNEYSLKSRREFMVHSRAAVKTFLLAEATNGGVKDDGQSDDEPVAAEDNEVLPQRIILQKEDDVFKVGLNNFFFCS